MQCGESFAVNFRTAACHLMSAGQQLVHQARDDCYRNTRHRKFSLEDEIMIITCESTNISKKMLRLLQHVCREHPEKQRTEAWFLRHDYGTELLFSLVM
jgi:hypothetical protein